MPNPVRDDSAKSSHVCHMKHVASWSFTTLHFDQNTLGSWLWPYYLSCNVLHDA